MKVCMHSNDVFSEAMFQVVICVLLLEYSGFCICRGGCAGVGFGHV